MKSTATLMERMALGGLLVLMSGIAAGPPAPTVQVRGSVLDAATALPLAGVQVQLVPTVAGRIAPIRGATGADGTFLLSAVPPGSYILAAKRMGYLAVTYESAPGVATLAVRPSGASAVTMRMTPLGVVAGSILWPKGGPMVHQRVMLSHFRTVNGARVLAPEREVWTDGEGKFQVTGVPSGRYLLSAAVVQSSRGMKRGLTNVPSFFPGVRDVKDAKPIEVETGRTVKDISLKLHPPVAARAVSGVLVDAQGAPVAGAEIVARPDVGGGTISLLSSDVKTALTSPKGRFVFPAVALGQYSLFAKAPAGGTWTASASVAVGPRGIKGLKMTALATATIEGRVIIEGKSGRPNIARVSLRPDPAVGFQPPPVATVSADGTFVMRGVPAGLSRFDISLLSDRYYVKEVRMSGDDVSGQAVNIPGGERVGDVTVVVSEGAAELSGSVAFDAAHGGPKPTVVVFPAQSELWDSSLHLVRAVNVDASGKFVVRGLRPGQYEAAALTGAAAGSELGPQFLAQVQTVSKHLELPSGKVVREVIPVADSVSPAKENSK